MLDLAMNMKAFKAVVLTSLTVSSQWGVIVEILKRKPLPWQVKSTRTL
jgi:hypothetical protein